MQRRGQVLHKCVALGASFPGSATVIASVSAHSRANTASSYFLWHLFMPLPYFLTHWLPEQRCPLAASMIVGPLIRTLNLRDKSAASLMEVRRGCKLGVGWSFTNLQLKSVILTCCFHTSKRTAREENTHASPWSRCVCESCPGWDAPKCCGTVPTCGDQIWDTIYYPGGTYLMAPIWWAVEWRDCGEICYTGWTADLKEKHYVRKQKHCRQTDKQTHTHFTHTVCFQKLAHFQMKTASVKSSVRCCRFPSASLGEPSSKGVARTTLDSYMKKMIQQTTERRSNNGIKQEYCRETRGIR